MFSYSLHIQEACKPMLSALFCALLLINCGKAPDPIVQTLDFQDNNVSFQNSTCSTQVTLINGSGVVYTLAFLTASFKDDEGHTRQIEFDQNQVIDTFDPVSIAPGAATQGNLVFDLQGAGFIPPITASVVLVGIAGSQVTHFVGNFTCQ